DYNVTCDVSDGETTVRFTTKSTVLNANAAPVIDQLDGWQVLEGQLLVFKAFACDPDNPYYTPAQRNMQTGEVVATTSLLKTVTVEVLSARRPGANVEPGTMELRWTPDSAQPGDYEVLFRATDWGDGAEPPLSTEITVPFRVFNQNRRPEVRTIENGT